MVGASPRESLARPDSKLITDHFAGSRVTLDDCIKYLLLNTEVINLLHLVNLLSGLLQLLFEQLVLLFEIIYFLDIYFIEFFICLVSL